MIIIKNNYQGYFPPSKNSSENNIRTKVPFGEWKHEWK